MAVVEGKLLLADEALQVGLVDEVVSVDKVVLRCLEWIAELRALPRAVMLDTRALARRPLRALFDKTEPAELDALVEGWIREDTQRALRALVARLLSRGT